MGDRMKESDSAKLEAEYAKLLEGLQANAEGDDDDDFMANPSSCPVGAA